MTQRLKRIQPPATPRISIIITQAIVTDMLAVLAALSLNVASSALPSFLRFYVSYAWLVAIVVVFLGIAVSTWRIWYSSGQGTHNTAPSLSQPVPSSTLVAQPASTPASSPTPTTTVSPAPVAASSHYHTCVISYSTNDELFVKKLYADLKSNGIPCWLADQDGKLGDKLRAEIYQAIGQLDKLLLVLSQHAIESKWVEEEVDVALDREHQQPGTFLLFPLRLDDSVLTSSKYWAITVRQRRIGDFRQWQQDTEYQQALQRVLRDLHV